ncbi:DNA mismatch repair protein MLH1, putative [Theileria equi strain WA]|uniref:DNA mismatch repair protein MLH1, putative n=1 Tax=Theileria equi strain WA TaxID=1537102 RepID=L1LEF5_THEEQ|nr:DNA mismatch repair protein MLH1, putative [Theileria equi strain WA]EKX73792.1 DNA mismatch repair protein MLH1, putative [Theileria equi strain WA]|eukprot:XP_004833244.1 DNA mismatch repair protein MLH1, putative [Theileria equi strain WA]
MEEDVIRPLPAEIAHKIAAGEIIIRPSAAIKELIENSIDAGSTLIQLNIAPNPMDSCEVIDNGCGISPNDMLIVCKRFTTSKTQNTIHGVKSLGFRGEALSALSQSSYVTISSRTKHREKRTVMRYICCNPVMDDIAEENGPQGFTIKYENLFYNLETRHKSLSVSSSHEFNLCLELVQKYSIHFPDINFIFHKLGNISHEFTTCNDTKLGDLVTTDYDHEHFTGQERFPPNVAAAEYHEKYKDNVDEQSSLYLKKVKNSIKNIYGILVYNIVYPFVSNSFNKIYYNCKGLFSHPNQSSRTATFIIFINNRLVELPPLRRSILNIYNEISNNRYRRFVYLSLFLPYDRIDANVHPSKQRLLLEDQDDIIDDICLNFKNELSKLSSLNSSTVPDSTSYNVIQHITPAEAEVEAPPTKSEEDKKEKTYNKFKVRNDYRQTDISYFAAPVPLESNKVPVYIEDTPEVVTIENEDFVCDEEASCEKEESTELDAIPPVFSFTEMRDGATLGEMWIVNSIKEILRDIDEQRDVGFTNSILNSVLVGVADDRHILIQHDAELAMINIVKIAREAAFQSILWRIGNLPTLELDPPLPLVDLLAFAIAKRRGNADDVETYISEAKGLARQTIIDVLNAVFSFHIEDLEILCIPNVLSNYFPGPEFLPDVLLNIFSQKPADEKKFIVNVSYCIAEYYTVAPTQSVDPTSDHGSYLSRILLHAVQRFPDLSLSSRFVKIHECISGIG